MHEELSAAARPRGGAVDSCRGHYCARSGTQQRHAAARSGAQRHGQQHASRGGWCAYRKVSRRKRFPPRVSVRWKAPAVLFKKELVAALSSPLSSDSAVFRAARSGELRLHSISDTSSKPLLGERALITSHQGSAAQGSAAAAATAFGNGGAKRAPAPRTLSLTRARHAAASASS